MANTRRVWNMVDMAYPKSWIWRIRDFLEYGVLDLVSFVVFANVEGENATNTATEEPPSHTAGETEDSKMAIPISSIKTTKVPPTQAQPITTITTYPESSQAAPRIDKGKGITTELDEIPLKKPVPASIIVCLDPDEEVKVPYMINGKMCYLTDKEMHAYLEKEEKLRKATAEARLLAISKPKVIKVVQEEAEKIGLDPNKIASAKAGEKFKKAQDAKHQVLKRENSQKVKRLTKLNKKRAKQYMNNDKRNFDVHQPFKFTYFRIIELDELGRIIQKKKNSIVKDLMTSLSKRYERKKGKAYGTRTQGQGWSGLSYLVMASMVKIKENARFSLKLRKLIADHPDQEKLKSKKVKLEALGYQID
ncbi:hypothetical protein Tco_0144301 [Tanacetum coccineum]